MSNNATICPKDYCRALIPATGTDRAAHLAGHASDEKAARAMRDELKAIRELIAHVNEDIRGFRNELNNIDIPEPNDALTIEEWPEDELPDEDDEDEQTGDDDSVDLADFTSGIAPEPDVYPAIDRDDDLDTRLANATGTVPNLGPLS